MQVRGAVVHYPLTRRTLLVHYDEEARRAAQADRAAVVDVVAAGEPPPRLPRPMCKDCAYADYCWAGYE